MGARSKLAADGFHHALKIFHHVAVPESDHCVPRRVTYFRACIILLLCIGVLPAMQFDSQLTGGKREIDDMAANRMLPTHLDRN